MPSDNQLVATATATLPARILDEGRLALEPSQREHARDLVAEFVDQVLSDSGRVQGDVVESIKLRVAEIDRLISAQLNQVMHAEEFQRLEASWRGLHHLVSRSET